jgi:hypothetical protein
MALLLLLLCVCGVLTLLVGDRGSKKVKPLPADQPRDKGSDNQDHARSGSAFEGSSTFMGNNNNNSEEVVGEEEAVV